MNGDDLAAQFITSVTWDDIPEAVRDKAKVCLLDTLGAIISGRLVPMAKIAERFAMGQWPGRGEATIFLSGLKSSAEGAAFVNANGANGLDIDDNGRYTRGHPGAQLIPVALAAGEKGGADGKEILTAIVIGYEVAHRIGRIWHETHEVYQACGSWGSVANAAVAARLMGLSHERTKQALGIADYYAPNLPLMRDIDNPAMTKHGIGWAAMTGIMAAGLALEDFTGVPSLLDLPEYRDWVSTLGRDYIMVEGVTFKKHASCSWGHPSFASTQKLIRENDIPLEAIERIRITGFHEMVRLGTRRPRNEEEAQFNVAWPLAALLIDGKVGPDQMVGDRLKDERILDLAAKVELHESEELNRLYRAKHYPCAVEIVLSDGRTFASGIEEYGTVGKSRCDSGGDLVTRAEVEDKFRWLCGHVIDAETIEKCVQLVYGFERLPDLKALTTLLA